MNYDQIFKILMGKWEKNCKSPDTYIYIYGIPETRNPRLQHSNKIKWNTGRGTPKFSSETCDPGYVKWELTTLMNNLLAWNFEYCNKYVDTLLEN